MLLVKIQDVKEYSYIKRWFFIIFETIVMYEHTLIKHYIPFGIKGISCSLSLLFIGVILSDSFISTSIVLLQISWYKERTYCLIYQSESKINGAYVDEKTSS